MTFIFLQLFEAAADNGSARLSDHLPYSLEVAPEHGVLYDCEANFNNSFVATSEMSSLALASPPPAKAEAQGSSLLTTTMQPIGCLSEDINFKGQTLEQQDSNSETTARVLVESVI